MKQLAITNATAILPGQSEPVTATLVTQGDAIRDIGHVEIPETALVIDARGKWLTPAIVDLGVFAIDLPAMHFGGIARAALMPDQTPCLDVPARIRFAALSAKPNLWVHPLAAATKGLAGTEMAELGLMKDAGAKAVATGRQWIADSGTMFRIMQYCAMLDLPLIAHAEDGGLAGNAVATQGEMATRLGLSSAPAEAEALAVARDITLAAMSGVRLHLRQVTTRAGLELVRRAKAEGVNVTAGITPAHFLLSDNTISDFRTFARLSPPLRSEDDRQACLQAIGDGTIDVIASGHDPRGPEDKRLPFADAEPGMAGAETLLTLSLTLVRDGIVSACRLFELLAENPARLLGLNSGRLEPGYQADLAIIDPKTPWIVDSGKMRAEAGNTPFDKLPVQGRCTALFKGGRQID